MTRSTHPTSAILILACGNPLREDDGLGYHAAQALIAEDIPGVRVITTHQLLPELAEDVSRASLVILIDARADGAPGELRQEAVSPCTPEAGARAGAGVSHHVDLAHLLYWAQTLYGSAPRAIACSLCGARLGYAEALSPPFVAAIPEFVAQVHSLINAEQERQASQTRPCCRTS
jgi:hydrogenase maturation protease